MSHADYNQENLTRKLSYQTLVDQTRLKVWSRINRLLIRFGGGTGYLSTACNVRTRNEKGWFAEW